VGLVGLFVTCMGVFVSCVLFLCILILLYALFSKAMPLKCNVMNKRKLDDLPLVSIIVPAYRGEEFLPRILKLISNFKIF